MCAISELILIPREAGFLTPTAPKSLQQMTSHDNRTASQVLRVIFWRKPPTQNSYWVRWRPEASCEYLPLANGGNGVVQQNDTAVSSCAVPSGVTGRWRNHFGVCW